MKFFIFAIISCFSFFLAASPEIVQGKNINPAVNEILKHIGVELPSTVKDFKEKFGNEFPSETSVRFSEETQNKILKVLGIEEEKIKEGTNNFIRAKQEFLKTPPQNYFGRNVDVITIGSSNYDGILHRLHGIVEKEKKKEIKYRKIVFLTGTHKMLLRFATPEQFIKSVSLLFPNYKMDKEGIYKEFETLQENERKLTHRDAFNLVLKFSPLGESLANRTEIFLDNEGDWSTEKLYTEFYKNLENKCTVLDVSTTFNDKNRHTEVQKYFDNSTSPGIFMGTCTVEDIPFEIELEFRGLTALSEIKDFLNKVFRQVMIYEN